MAMAMRESWLWSAPELKDVSVLPARMALGASMLYHGREKLKSEGIDGYVQFFEGVGIKPGRFWVRATGLAEMFIGLASELGIATRLAALATLVTQGVAILKVHAPKGYDTSKGGFEYNLALIGIALGLLIAGPGRLSLHEALERLVEGRGSRRLLHRARPGRLLRTLKLIK